MRRRTINRGLGEILVVVVGILLAFGVDSLWQRAQDRRLGSEIVSGLVTSFEANRAELETWVGRRRDKLAATHELLLVVTQQASAIPPDSVAALLRSLRSYQGFDSNDSRLREVLASGRMHLIRGGELRARLSGWEAKYQDLRGVEDLARQHSMQVVDAWLNERIPVTGGPGRYDPVPPRPLGESDVRLLRTLEFENLLRQQYFLDRLADGRGTSLLQEMDVVLRLLGDETDSAATAF